jgi:hypothetical protein
MSKQTLLPRALFSAHCVSLSLSLSPSPSWTYLLARQIAAAEASVAESEDRIKVLTELVSSMESKKVGPRTTLEELYELYPDLQEEIETEIDNHEWGKDIQ